VEPMVGLDAKFLYSETPTAHMHTLKVAVFDVGSVPGGVSFEDLEASLAQRLDRLPPLRRRVVPVPLALGHPVWIEDPDFELRRHVRHRTLDPPGGDRELAALVAHIAGRPLPRDRPLWEIVFVDGLAGNRLAAVAKIHHAVADGATSVALLLQALASRSGGATEPWRPEPVPNRAALLRTALDAHRRRLRRLPWLVTRTVTGLRQAAAQRRAASVRPPLPLTGPRTPFNVSLSAERTFAMTTLPLEDLKVVRRTFDTTLNDVFLATCGGALRAYLLELGALPSHPLVASVPVSTAPRSPRRGGNHLDNLFVSIGTDIADPLARLHHIAAVTVGAKDVRSALGTDLLQRRAEVVPPQLYAMSVRVWERTRLANHLPPPLNLVLSNVPGPREPVRFGRAVIESLYSVGPILEGIGLNITAWSYVDALHVSVLASPTTVADPWRLADALAGSLSELKSASKRDRDLAPSPGPL